MNPISIKEVISNHQSEIDNFNKGVLSSVLEKNYLDCIVVSKIDFVRVITSKQPYYDKIEKFSKYGSFVGGNVDKFYWNVSDLQDLTIEELIEINLLLGY